jgi:hypothetical protein
MNPSGGEIAEEIMRGVKRENVQKQQGKTKTHQEPVPQEITGIKGEKGEKKKKIPFG